MLRYHRLKGFLLCLTAFALAYSGEKPVHPDLMMRKDEHLVVGQRQSIQDICRKSWSMLHAPLCLPPLQRVLAGCREQSRLHASHWYHGQQVGTTQSITRFLNMFKIRIRKA